MNSHKIVVLLIIIALTVALVFFTRWYFNAVLASGLPDWVKYLLLRR